MLQVSPSFVVPACVEGMPHIPGNASVPVLVHGFHASLTTLVGGAEPRVETREVSNFAEVVFVGSFLKTESHPVVNSRRGENWMLIQKLDS